MKKASLVFLFFWVLGFVCYGNDDLPMAISPGIDGGIGLVDGRCPTFSWSGVAWAERYKVVIFLNENNGTRNYEEMAVSAPVLTQEIAGGAFSWTPSLEQGLPSGVEYVWYVGAMDAAGNWLWSEGKQFRVEENIGLAVIEEVRTGLKQQGIKDEVIDKVLSGVQLDSFKRKPKDFRRIDPVRPLGTEEGFCTFYGDAAGAHNSSDTNQNSFFGYDAGFSNTTGFYNTFMGFESGRANTTGDRNTFMGMNAGNSNTTAYENTFVGMNAGVSNTSGYYNTFMGASAGYANTTGIYNTFMGYAAGASNTTGYENTFMGLYAGYSNTTGLHNTFMGQHAGYSNTTGYDNTFMGLYAGYSNTTGFHNNFMGYHAGKSNTTGSDNTFMGGFAGYANTTGNGNVFLGFNAGYNETGSDKLYIDNSDTASPLIYGDFSTDMVGINGWLGVGTQAPAYPMELKTTGRNASFVATRTDGAVNFMNATATNGQFGTVNNYPVRILVNASPKMTINANNSLVMASGATCTVGGVWQNASSRSLKENIVDLETQEAMETLKGLTPVKFTYKADGSDGQVGFIAEDVPDLVATKDRKGMSAMDVVAVLTKVVQEQQKAIVELKDKLSYLEKKLETEK